jgi:hypothetical protein
VPTDAEPEPKPDPECDGVRACDEAVVCDGEGSADDGGPVAGASVDADSGALWLEVG